MPRPRVTLRRKGMTSSCPSGPPNPASRIASYATGTSTCGAPDAAASDANRTEPFVWKPAVVSLALSSLTPPSSHRDGAGTTRRYDHSIMPITDRQRPLYEVKANLFKGLAHPFRIRILELLAAAPEVSVADLQAETGLEASHLSQHLAVLWRHGLVASERRASHVYYRLADPRVADLLAVARALLLTVLETDR